MKRIFNFFFILIGLTVMTLFAQGGKVNAVIFDNEQTESFFHSDTIHAVDLLQPQTVHHSVAGSKAEHFSVFRFSDIFQFPLVRFVTLKRAPAFFSQDINRCEKVSLLLFPYHFFW